jgi:hypothetical protein
VDEKWRVLTRVRDVRARLALDELARQRGLRARAQATLDQARQRKALLEAEAAQASRMVSGAAGESGQATFEAARAQEILSFAAGALAQARLETAPIRRAQLQCDRTQEAVDQAGAKARREAQRREAVNSHWQKLSRAARRARLEHEDENGAEDHVGFSLVHGRSEE